VSDLTTWKLHGPVRTLRIGHAEWDLRREEWQPPTPHVSNGRSPWSQGRVQAARALSRSAQSHLQPKKSLAPIPHPLNNLLPPRHLHTPDPHHPHATFKLDVMAFLIHSETSAGARALSAKKRNKPNFAGAAGTENDLP